MEGYRGLAQHGGTPREVAEVVNLILQGKLNALAEVTLTASVTSTVLTDERLSGSSWIEFMPLTANAAAEKAAGTMWVSAQGQGAATVTHSNSAQVDRNFRLLIIG